MWTMFYDVYKILKEEGMVWPGLVDLPGQSATRGFGWLLGYGPKIVDCFQKRLDKLGVQTLYKHRGQRLTVDPATGRVNGAIVLDGETKKFIKAKIGRYPRHRRLPPQSRKWLPSMIRPW